MFVKTQNGFLITFTNGNCVSVEFGEGNKCENRFVKNTEESLICRDAEIRVWDKNGYDLIQPIGYQSPEQALEIMKQFS